MSAVRVIVINFNAGEALSSCLAAVLDQAGDLAVTVADNASEDGSMEAVASRFGAEPRLKLRFNDRNLGFAAAVNRIAREAREQYLLVLNPDCILRPGALRILVEALDRDPRAAIAGPWVTDASGKVQKGTWRRLPDPWHSLMTVTGLHRISKSTPALEGINVESPDPPESVTRAEAVSGACMLIRRSAAEAVGFFDEAYAMHCEDLDLMCRLGRKGFHCLLVPAARAVHEGGVSSASRPWWVHRQKHLGMQRYFRKLQAGEHSPPVRWLVYSGIWAHYVLTLPLVLFSQGTKAA